MYSRTKILKQIVWSICNIFWNEFCEM